MQYYLSGRSQRLTVFAGTTMSCALPPEILDFIIDHLADEPAALKVCCIISKSWVLQTRKHLFAHVELDALRSHMDLWKKAFPDPSNSPAYYTRTLSIRNASTLTATDTDVEGWIYAFCNVVHLEFTYVDGVTLVLFYGLSPTVRSLRLINSTTGVFDLVYSFPLLEDLTLINSSVKGGVEVWNPPPTSLKLTGTLELRTLGVVPPIARRLLNLPHGLRFSKIRVAFLDEEIESVNDLVSACSATLESLVTFYYPWCAFHSAPVTDQYLTTVHRRSYTQDGSPRPLQGYKTQVHNVLVGEREDDRPVDYHDTPNPQIQKPSTHHHLPNKYPRRND